VKTQTTYSALPCPKGCFSSAGLVAIFKPMSTATPEITSWSEYRALAVNARLPVNIPMTLLKIVRKILSNRPIHESCDAHLTHFCFSCIIWHFRTKLNLQGPCRSTTPACSCKEPTACLLKYPFSVPKVVKAFVLSLRLVLLFYNFVCNKS